MEQQINLKLHSKVKTLVPTFEQSRMEHQDNAAERRKKEKYLETQISQSTDSVQWSVERMKSWKAKMKGQLEALELQIKESEEICKRQHHNILTSEKSLTELTSQCETEIKNKNDLLAKLQETRINVQALQEQCKLVANSLHRMMRHRDDIKGSLISDKKKRYEFECCLSKWQATYNNLLTLRQEKLEEIKQRFKREKKALCERNEQTLSVVKSRNEELNLLIRQKEAEIDNLGMQLNLFNSQMEKLGLGDSFIQNLEKKKPFRQETEKVLMKRKDELEQLLQDIDKSNAALNTIIEENSNVESELEEINERCSALKITNDELKGQLASSQSTLSAEKLSFTNIEVENAAYIENLKEPEETIRKDLEAIKRSFENEIAALENKVSDALNVYKDLQLQQNSIQKQIQLLKQENEDLNKLLASEKQSQTELESELDSLNAEQNEKLVQLKEILLSLQEMTANQQIQTSSLKINTENMKTLCDEREIQKRTITEKIKHLTSYAASIEETKKPLESQVSDLKSLLQEVQRRINQNDEVLPHNSELISSLQAELETAQRSIAAGEDNQRELENTLQAELNALCLHHQVILNELSDNLQAIQIKETDSKHLKSSHHLLRSKITETNERMERIEFEISEYVKANNNVEEDMELNLPVREEEIRNLEMIHDANQTTQAQLATNLQEESSKLGFTNLQLKEEKENLEKLRKEQQEHRDVEIKSENELMVTEVNLQSHLNKAKDELKSISINLENRRESRGILNIKINECKSEIRGKTNENSSIIQSREEEIECMRLYEREYSQCKPKLQKLTDSFEKLQREKNDFLVNYRKQKEILVNDLNAVKQSCKDRLQEICNLTGDLRESKNKLGHSTAALKQSKEEHEAIQKKTVSLENNLKELRIKAFETKKEYYRLQIKMKQSQQSMAKLKKYNDRISRNLAALKSGKKKSPELKDSMKDNDIEFLRPLSKAFAESENILPGPVVNSVGISTPQKQIRPNSEMSTPNAASTVVTPRSILKTFKVPTPQQPTKSVSFALETESDSSIIIEPEDTEAIERDPQNVHHILQNRRAFQSLQKTILDEQIQKDRST